MKCIAQTSFTPLIGQAKAFEQSTKDRKKVEMVFAHMKRIIGLRRFRLRGILAVTVRCSPPTETDRGWLRSTMSSVPPRYQLVETVDLVICDAAAWCR